ncbi:MAG: hypothetical protein KR126chlam5_00142 [Candidatus Anoxychlamydiales bacterium]|nr:hypothetical protein [Candidatus Anoxychlamydiales bacterium]NGX51854.1 hypothetical protein [Candidatus Anoxychlamydiales bacterium]
MTNTQVNEKEKTVDEKNYSEKRLLKDVLSAYLEKKQNEKPIKIRKDLSKLNLNFTKEKTSVETLLEVQKKINLAYNNISDTKNGEKKTKKDS